MPSTKIPFTKKLSSKISFAILAGALLSVGVIGALTFSFTTAALQRAIMDQQVGLAKQTLNKADRMLYERLGDIQSMAQEDLFAELLQEHIAYPQAVNPVLIKEATKRLNNLTLLTGPWDVLFVVDAEGKIMLSADEPLLGQEIQNYPVKAIAYNASVKGEVYYSDLVVSKDTGLPTIIFSAPVRDLSQPSKPVIGVVVGNFSWPAVLEILGEIPAQTFLLNRQGKIIGNDLAMSNLSSIADNLNNGLSYPEFTGGKPRAVIASKGKGILPEEALTSIAVQVGYLSYKGSGWSLVIAAPVASAFKPATETATKLVFLLLPIIVATPLLILFIIMRLVVRPLADLNRTMQAITAGDLKRRAAVPSKDEIGRLAESFNEMTSRLMESYETLEKKVEQRTHELSNTNATLTKSIEERQRLEHIALQSEKMAAVGQLAGGVAHEINNPLGVILGFAQSLARRVPSGDIQEMPLKSIEREALRCKSLVQDLLTFSRMNRTDKEAMDLNEAVEGSLSLVSAQTKVKNVSLMRDFNGDLPKIVANKNQIQQIVVNLCNNAIDAMPEGGTLTVSTRKSSWKNKDAVQIQVRDTGQGIPKEVQSKIFEPFFTTKEVGKGTGLGLSLVFEIVQKHEGQITVESEMGKGTVFTVMLNCAP